MNDEESARADETIDESFEIFEAAPEFQISPALNVNPDNSIQDDIDVEVQDA